MKEIIRLGTIKPEPERIMIGTCGSCGTEFKFGKSDVFKGNPHSNPGYWVTCPLCNKLVNAPWDWYTYN
jgi:hypothetical protein